MTSLSILAVHHYMIYSIQTVVDQEDLLKMDNRQTHTDAILSVYNVQACYVHTYIHIQVHAYIQSY